LKVLDVLVLVALRDFLALNYFGEAVLAFHFWVDGLDVNPLIAACRSVFGTYVVGVHHGF
jgi:hypothetical protein